MHRLPLTKYICILQNEHILLEQRTQLTGVNRLFLNQHTLPTKHIMHFWCCTLFFLQSTYIYMQTYELPLHFQIELDSINQLRVNTACEAVNFPGIGTY